MIKKFLYATTFLSLIFIMSGCAAEAPDVELPELATPKQFDENGYFVSKAPSEARIGVKDPTKGFIKINPKFSYEDYPKESNEAPKWFKNGLGSKIPAMDNGNILEVINNDNQFLTYIGNIDEEKFEKYIEKLLAQGYQYGESKNWESLEFFNDKYEINLRFSQDGDKVTTLRAKILDK